MDIAVIGTGISGLAAAATIHDHHQVTVFEAANRLGGHTNTVTVLDDGEPLAIDTGFIVYNR
jgi:predicted NAD/FAD-binding protein